MAPTESLTPTPLLDRHEAAGAHLGPFAGWRLPVRFAGTVAEHMAVREDVGAFDVSHLGTVWLEGERVARALARALTHDPYRVEPGDSQYTLCCDERGGIIDDLIVLRVDERRWVAMPNAANREAVLEPLSAAAEAEGVELTDETEQWAVLAVQGPSALPLASSVLGIDVGGLAFTAVTTTEREGAELIVSRTGYTGEPGCEIQAPAGVAGGLWDELLAAGATPCGLAARDTLRLEMGYPLHGQDLSTETTPFETRLGWTVRLDREPRPPSADALERLREQGAARRLLGLVGQGRRPLREGQQVLVDDAPVGTVTSGSYSPVLGVGIGMALLDREVEPGTAAEVDVRGRRAPVEVVRPPMVDRDPRD